MKYKPEGMDEIVETLIWAIRNNRVDDRVAYVEIPHWFLLVVMN